MRPAYDTRSYKDRNVTKQSDKVWVGTRCTKRTGGAKLQTSAADPGLVWSLDILKKKNWMTGRGERIQIETFTAYVGMGL
ncbi:hypothetical protein HNY73_015650 [Argiope bruennichi]|uniref:Uncharacterized protein n=1 Tax=Argiope bruennichi TaxID=94029 RepID=A0A8T0ELY5_ARGBR|nr:hypothetical protein HNY73_015650 [Argiope bruennichi]